jgi:hypothetical protein
MAVKYNSLKNTNVFSCAIHCELILLTCGLFIFILFFYACNPSFQIAFKHHVIANPLPGISWGTGGFTLADYDKDGDLDVTVQRRSDEDKAYWYEYQSMDNWIPHFIGTAEGYQLGATSIDVNRDGYIDLVMGHVWFQNPGNLKINPDSDWGKHLYNGDMQEENHDIVAADLNLDGIEDIVMYNQNAGTLRWYNTTDPYNWTYTDIATDVNDNYVHSGLFPSGIVDLDKDNYPDLIMPIHWYKNPGASGEKWMHKTWPYTPIDTTPYGKGIRVWAGDINKNGFNDIIYSDCDVRFSKIYLLINEDGGETWEKEEIFIPNSNVVSSGSFHSLQVADLDNDGDLDIFAGEQEDPYKLMKPDSLKERGIVFLNTGKATSPKFSPIIIQEDNPGWHDALIGDIDADGDVDIVSKVWNADETNYHLDCWENQLK